MKSVIAVGEFAVSFNTSIGGYEVGDERAHTIDFAGDYIDALAAEVIADDPSFPMTFRREESWELVVGVFHKEGNPENVVAVMVEYSAM